MREEARAWYEGALVDLAEARSAFREGRYNWAVFAAHQAVEKALKSALMVFKREPPPRTSDLTRLLSILGLELPEDLRAGVMELSPFYTVARYPNAGLERPWEGISRGLAAKLLRVAEEVVEYVGRAAELK
ncbi:MAG: HEPN domain-containing protein [Thermofilum sp.]